MDLSRFSPKQLLEIDACTRCGDCLRFCPVYGQRAEEGITPRGKIQALKKFLQKQYGLWARIFGKPKLDEAELERFSEMVYRCTLCGECAVQCPVSIDSRTLWLALKEVLVDLGHFPKNVGMMRKNVLGKYNISGEANSSRTNWLDGLEGLPAHRYQKERAEVVYFVGCVSAYFPMAYKVPQSFTQILDRAGVDFTLLGGEEWCCGFPLIGAGFRKEVEGFIRHHIEGVKERGAHSVVFSCPSCYHTWHEEYHTDFHLYDSTQFLLHLLREGKLRFKGEKVRVTYHDPCDLGRHSGIYEEPREVLRSIPGVELVELATHREQSKCCGGGGLLEMVDPELSIALAKEKIKSIQATGADVVVSACQQCVRTIQSTARRMKVPLKVMYISEFVLKYLA
ncbi:MAG: (Fe-S)-binding protein [Desulfobacterota bacterium]|nr:(Fe-S)-binding protein [Thermodesulfobacteriota bacterium]